MTQAYHAGMPSQLRLRKVGGTQLTILADVSAPCRVSRRHRWWCAADRRAACCSEMATSRLDSTPRAPLQVINDVGLDSDPVFALEVCEAARSCPVLWEEELH